MCIIYLVVMLIFFVFGWVSSTGIKSQLIRLFDITLYGPILIWVSFSYVTDNLYLRLFLLFIGVTTISYNLRNYTNNFGKRYDSSIVHPASM